jgi:chromosome segregation ATPase
MSELEALKGAVDRNTKDIEKLGGEMSAAVKDIADVKANDAAQTEALKALGETAKHTRDDIKQLRDETKQSVDGLATRVLDEMSAKREDDSKATLRVLGIVGAIVSLVGGLMTWYITGSIPDKAPTVPGVEATP